MRRTDLMEESSKAIVAKILSDYNTDRDIDRMDDKHQQLDTRYVIEFIEKMQKVLLPGYFREIAYKSFDLQNQLTLLIEDSMVSLNRQILFGLKYLTDMRGSGDSSLEIKSQELTIEFFSRIPKIREYLETDLQAAYDGDPAARSKAEIIFAYPGIYAITVYRIAHELYDMGVPVIPRIMTEYAHSKAGIDIHPGAQIGKYFFIDHGTGIVVGETTIIGQKVKIYQGVTLGALSTRGGQKLRGVQRHPTIGDNVTIYSGASILGGTTEIGRGCIIGSNAFITQSIPAGTRVTIKGQELIYKYGRKGIIEMAELEQDSSWIYNI